MAKDTRKGDRHKHPILALRLDEEARNHLDRLAKHWKCTLKQAVETAVLASLLAASVRGETKAKKAS